MPETSKITPRALLELKMLGDVRLAPDGRRAVFSVTETDWDENQSVQHLFVVPTDGSVAARQVTRGQSDESEPRWSPDGHRLAFLATRDDKTSGDRYDDDDEDDSPQAQVWLLPMDGYGGEAERLTDVSSGVSAYEWLPDGSGIVYLAQEPRAAPLQSARAERQERKDDAIVERAEKFRQQIWRIDLDEKKPKLIHAGDWGIGEIAVSPDGCWVAYTTNYTGEENDYHRADVWVLEVATGQTRQLTQGPGGKFHPVWTPDSLSVLYCASRNPELSFSQESLRQVSLAEAESIFVTEAFPHDLIGWHGVWCDAAGAIYVSVAVGTTTGIYKKSPEADEFLSIVQEDAHIHDFHVAADGGLAFVASSASDAPELFWLAPGAREPVVLTDLNDEWQAKYRVAETEIVTYESTEGLAIEALLTLPPDVPEGEPLPLLVALHGGPHGRVAQALSPFSVAQVWAAEGYAVLSPNYRGSEGYGESFGTASKCDLGGGDFRDVMAGVDWAIAEGIADPDRLGVLGSSYGAYLVNWALTQTQRFRGAVSQFGIFSLSTDFSNSQAPRWDMEYLGGFPWDNADIYARLSPATRVAEIQTPVLIMHGEGDPNTFIANSQEMYQALRLLGRPVEFVRYPREGHGFFEPQHRLDEMRRTLAWFDRYVKGRGTRASYRIGDPLTLDDWELVVTSVSLASYMGRDPKPRRYLEVSCAVRDRAETRRSLTLGPNDFRLSRVGTEKPLRPIGIPVAAPGGNALALGRGWKFVLVPDTEERGLAAGVSVVFQIGGRAGTYTLQVKSFPSVMFDVPASDDPPQKRG